MKDRINFETLVKEENPIQKAKDEAEIKLIEKALELSDGNKTQAAKFLKISRPLLYQKIERLKIK